MAPTFEKKLIGGSGAEFSGMLVEAVKIADSHDASLDVLLLTADQLQIRVTGTSEEQCRGAVDAILPLGFIEVIDSPIQWQAAPADGVAPDGFYSTTHHDTEVLLDGNWQRVDRQRMDGCIILVEGVPTCIKLRDLSSGQAVAMGIDGIRVITAEDQSISHSFSFMSNDVSSERQVEIHARVVAQLARDARDAGRKIVWVPGPVVVHTGAASDLEKLVEDGWVDAVLSGNALAVHDIESQLLGTSLGVSVTDGQVIEGGHSHHMRAINRIRGEGSISAAVSSGALEGGLMHTLVKNEVPFVLAGSIRDDGPLPETVMDLFEAQELYAQQLQDAGLVVVLASMLHGIGVGNMLPGKVPLVCVDIHPAVATKLADRGSAQTFGIVTDVGLFLRRLREQLIP